uniref:E3 ubiquitin-protein ligase Itchy n=1 Tax=Anthurium amnicola TaxID=1678845 RepID=A0A1D1YBP3_9ARAE
MIREFGKGKRGIVFETDRLKVQAVKNQRQLWRGMDRPELSLGPLSSFADGVENLSPESESSNACRKRKSAWDEPLSLQTGIELQLKDPLPLDWEQCLDLQSGRMYYLNRKTLKRTWDFPNDQTLDLELNISPPLSLEGNRSPSTLDSSREENFSATSMVAVACLKCHLLVMLCRSSPSCPNCKYVHSLLPPAQQPAPSKVDRRPRSLETLSLLH